MSLTSISRATRAQGTLSVRCSLSLSSDTFLCIYIVSLLASTCYFVYYYNWLKVFDLPHYARGARHRYADLLSLPRRCPCPGSVPWSAAGWPAAGGMAYSVVRLALAKSQWLFAAL